jgi:EAL domain-containing protein (putative c-di-GMP-specific phosphodiesterase class I)
VAGPLVLSVELAWREGLGNQRATTLSYALDVLRRIGSDLRSPGTIDLFRTLLTASNVQPRNITAEATERGFVDAEEGRQTLNSLRKLGIAVAIDDFGTGYSSLSRLENLKLELPQDRQVIRRVDWH